ncbi:unnamed protein product [Linum tenue]|uniref:Uncharacterized protein n=2 Tax=Linum tenue TaxID=586396 RepID=A0AAV0NK01_9ROSI|nr:unnamed protein product [Linum tenue]
MADLYDVMTVKIPKNATIPTMKFESRLTTVVDNQPNLKIAVYQGERRKASANQLLGTLMFEGIPPAPKGAKVTTSFDIDTMGNLNVSVKDKTSGWKETKSIPGVGVKGKLQLASAEEMSRQGEKHKSEDEEHLKRASITKAMMEYTIMIRENAAAGDFSKNVHSAFEDAVGKMLDELKEKAKEFGSEYDTKKSATVMSTFCGIPFRKKDWIRKNKN